jgi:hypothetical protein
MGKEEKKVSTRDTVIGGIIVLAIILGIAFAIVWYGHKERQDALDKGCIPAGSNWLGPTDFRCPNEKETKAFIDRGCTPILRDVIGTTWSCPK